ncbi:acyl-CoA Delta(11) desaturase-like [Epargyreus clarus]|uniref:acyl-CoA Delta(11) desaturase-like n=1 Tax=Epargyreus clarus TaxID=520877 RepID=UPI003C2BC285
MAALGVTAGAHRLWSHRTYKAKMPLQIILMLFNCVACQRTVVKWARDHRLHHKYSDTDADPHNAARGLFFSHVGWMLVKKHPEAIEKGKLIDASDLTSNPVLMFQEKYAVYLFGSICFLVPTLVPIIFWDESLLNSWHVTLFRYAFSLNVAFLVNSAAHRWGYKPYDSRIMPSQSIFISILTLGEAFHNYHHVFPWDYRTAELGNDKINFSTKFIDFFAWIGWAYDLKTAPNHMIKTRIQRTGDGTNLWGM